MAEKKRHLHIQNQIDTYMVKIIALDFIVHDHIIVATIVWKKKNPHMITGWNR